MINLISCWKYENIFYPEDGGAKLISLELLQDSILQINKNINEVL
jgi:hypothetical protein